MESTRKMSAVYESKYVSRAAALKKLRESIRDAKQTVLLARKKNGTIEDIMNSRDWFRK